MRKLYGDSLRKEAGFVKVIKNVASKNARLLESRAGRHAPEIKRVAKEVKGTFEKVFEETADVVEEFLAKCTYQVDVSPSVISQAERPLLSQAQDLRSHARNQGSAPTIARTSGYNVSHPLSTVAFVVTFSDSVCFGRLRRVASDLSSYDTAKYKVAISPSAAGNTRFHLGEPIHVKWEAPQRHSRRDWIGIYRVRPRFPFRP
jgi:phosphatidylethanolamine N-methyltransferase